MDLNKSTVNSIIKRVNNKLEDPFSIVKRTRRPPKLDKRAERRLVRYAANNPFDSLICLSTPGKSNSRMCINTTRKYLYDIGLDSYKARKKLYVNKK